MTMDWLLGNATGYVKLQVPADRAEAARAALESIRSRRQLADDSGDLAAAACLACGADMPAPVRSPRAAGRTRTTVMKRHTGWRQPATSSGLRTTRRRV